MIKSIRNKWLTNIYGLAIFLSSIAMLSCSGQSVRESSDRLNSNKTDQEVNIISLRDRIAWLSSHNELSQTASEKLYTFKAKNLNIRQVLNLFAQAYRINMVIDEEVRGNVSVDFRGLSFDQAMSAILDSNGLYWKKDRDLVHVRSTETRTFNIDYIRLIRSGSGSSQAQVSSGSSDSSGGGSGSGTTAGAMVIEQADKVDFWKELEDQLKVFVSKSGRLVTNRLAGTIQVTDQHRRVEEIARYIKQLNQAIYRQVDIQVKIVEVTLNDDFKLGVDWTRLVSNIRSEAGARNNDFIINNLVTQPAGGLTALPSSLEFTFSELADDGANRATAVLHALSEQGEVEIVSQPRIRTLNNQSALIKVGTDRTFFRREQLTESSTSNLQILSSDVPQVVTEGIVLAITPQISVDGWITMDISPVVTRVSSVSEVKDKDGILLSSAPNLDISQSSSLVRARSGETIVLGGLIQTVESDTERGIPGFKRIPILGHLFKSTYKTDQRRELVMMVTPRLIEDDIFSNLSSISYED